jgi:hypothetical protein
MGLKKRIQKATEEVEEYARRFMDAGLPTEEIDDIKSEDMEVWVFHWGLEDAQPTGKSKMTMAEFLASHLKATYREIEAERLNIRNERARLEADRARVDTDRRRLEEGLRKKEAEQRAKVELKQRIERAQQDCDEFVRWCIEPGLSHNHIEITTAHFIQERAKFWRLEDIQRLAGGKTVAEVLAYRIMKLYKQLEEERERMSEAERERHESERQKCISNRADQEREKAEHNKAEGKVNWDNVDPIPIFKRGP